MNPIPRVSARKYRGLGDVVHAVAHPLAAAIDAIAKTDIQNCPGCAARRKMLNRKIPFKKRNSLTTATKLRKGKPVKP